MSDFDLSSKKCPKMAHKQKNKDRWAAIGKNGRNVFFVRTWQLVGGKTEFFSTAREGIAMASRQE